MAKKFFYACAGLLCLAVTYHLGARSAHSEGVVTVDGAHIDCDRGPNGTILVTGVVGRTVYWNGQPATLPPVPGTSRVVATCGGYDFLMVALENGDMYRGLSGQWTYLGNLVGTPTPTQHESWGRLKTHYR